MITKSRAESKALYEDYRTTASELAEAWSIAITVGQRATVHPCEDGAFVEATIWVSDEAAEADARQGDAMSEWQPMETAPKDGRGLLLASGSNMRVAYWTEYGWAFYQRRLSDPVVVMLQPTHWMALPEPPK